MALRAHIGDLASEALLDMVHDAGREWHDDVWERAINRFERRLSEELGSVRVEIAGSRAEILRWCFVFLITQLAALAGMVAYLR
jgi:hypothetical protein